MRLKPIFIALATAFIGAVLLSTYLRRFDEEASGGLKIEVLTLNRALEAGAAIREDMLGTREIPQAYLEPRAVRSSDRMHIVGLRVALPMKEQTMLLWTDVAIGDSEHGVEIQPGMRAFTIHVSGKSASLVNAGDHVDLIGTFDMPGTGTNPVRQSTVLLQNVLVLAHGKSRTTSSADAESNDLSINVTLQSAEMLALALEKGTLTVALRNATDVTFFDQLTTLRSTQLLDLDPAKAVRPAGPSGPQRF